ncbi:MAG: 2-amino-4-hydroxy-6-hydroxymethyldihydropteridine diphosphokinase [Actinobacteria bacterium]|nr:2-amino-4-hydroxy-6-hydroxymethyldihydropteridine diphosphokinase [Actinomycetota bacterium]
MAYLGLGSNLGDRLDSLQRAVDLLGDEAGITLTRCSRVWETDPVGGPPQPDFLNVVVRAQVDLLPLDLLAACQRVEAALGRVREVRWGPRTVDIDVLLIADRAIDEPELVVPHPRLHERAFVLMPLLELEPDPVLPDGTRLVDVRLGPDAAGGVRVLAPPLRLP